MKPTTFLLAAMVLLASAGSHSENLGTVGQTYDLDRDGREQLKDIARRKQANGELDIFWKNYRDKVENAIRHPAPLGIKSNYEVRSELRSLRFVIPQNYRDESGKIIAKKGTVIEPLKIQPLQAGLIFIDGRDQRQIDYAIRLGRKEPYKIVLTAGSPLELRIKYQNIKWMHGTGIPFYFDQRKMIITNFRRLYGISIDSVPAALHQRGDKLVIDFGMSPL